MIRPIAAGNSQSIPSDAPGRKSSNFKIVVAIADLEIIAGAAAIASKIAGIIVKIVVQMYTRLSWPNNGEEIERMIKVIASG